RSGINLSLCLETIKDINPQYLFPIDKHRGGSIMVWTAFSWESLGLKTPLHGFMMAREYESFLQDQINLSLSVMPLCH
uniref:Uncharacterized protein n=1 Tax=Scleropages formosus TaxID=113540 RepID=A0A8C9V2Q8_SCLFO